MARSYSTLHIASKLKPHYQRINFYLFIYCGLFPLILVVFCVVSSFTTFRPNSLWPSSGDLPRPRIGMLSLVTVSPVITAFHSCCLSHHVFDQVNLWPAWVGFETAIFWQCSAGIEETHRLNILKFGTDPILEDQIRIYETKKSILDRPSGPVAQRIEAVSLFGSILGWNSNFRSAFFI